jgi:hypothetical protein
MPGMSMIEGIPEPDALSVIKLSNRILKVQFILSANMLCLEQQNARRIQKWYALNCPPNHVRPLPSNAAVPPEDPFIRCSRFQHDVQPPSARFWIKAP